MQIGFIGLGVMGLSMARNLMRGGHALHVYTRTKAKAEPILAEGALWHDSTAACAAVSDAVITIIGYPKDVEQVYFGEGGILANAKPGSLIIDMTTSEPGLAVKIAQEAKACGLRALDAPVSGGDTGAKNATLTIMVGGEKEDVALAHPLLSLMGSSIHHMGGPGAGQHTKMANQIAIAGALAGVCEALGYAQTAGLDTARVLGAIGGGAAGSWQMQYNGPKITAQDMSPGFYIKHFVKDLRIALREAEKAGFPLAIEPRVLEMLETLEANGMGEMGTQALIRHYLPGSGDASNSSNG